MILLIDNYDSFVHNLARYFRRLGQETTVIRNDASAEEILQRYSGRLSAIVLSPGPCAPRQAGCSVELVRRCGEIPLLGVCLGHQAIAAARGGEVVRAVRAMHGRASPISHAGRGLFENAPQPLTACRYHSLIVREASLPKDLEIDARDEIGESMALRHRSRPLFGVQFHPESILTPNGYDLLANFLRLAGLSTAEPASLWREEADL